AAAAAAAGAVDLPGIGIRAGAGFASWLLGRSVQDRLGAAARKQRGKGLRVVLLQPRGRLRRIRELAGDPRRRLIDPGVLDVLTAYSPLAVGSRLLFRHPPHLVGVLEIGSDLTL